MELADSSIYRDSIWHNEQVRLLYDNLGLALVFNLLLAGVMTGVIWSAVWHGNGLAWLAVLLATVAFRASLLLRYRRLCAFRTPEYWLQQFRIGVLATGMAWGCASILLFAPHDITSQVYLAFVLAGVCAGAISSLSADRVSALGFIIFVLVPLIARFALEGGAMPTSMALMVLLYVVFIAVAAHRMQQTLFDNLLLRTDALAKEDELRESEKRFRYMLETCPTAARIARAKGHEVVFFNQRYVELVNSTADKVGGVDPSKYYVNPAVYDAIIQRLEKGEQVFETLIELNIPGAGRKWALASYLPIQYGGVSAVLGWFHDITERVNMEQMKSEFVSTVSHELRTPLTAISGSLGLLAGGALGALPDKVMDLLRIAASNSQRLTFMINDLLDIEKLSAGKMTFDMQICGVSSLLEKAIEENSAYGNSRKIRIMITEEIPDVSIRVDRQRFLQVLANLLSNAIKYSPDDEKVMVSVKVENGRVRIDICDHGPGIPDEFRSRIFQKFAQADSSDSRQKGGTGLGLAITRELVHHMNGEIGFETVQNEGTNFYVHFALSSATG